MDQVPGHNIRIKAKYDEYAGPSFGFVCTCGWQDGQWSGLDFAYGEHLVEQHLEGVRGAEA